MALRNRELHARNDDVSGFHQLLFRFFCVVMSVVVIFVLLVPAK